MEVIGAVFVFAACAAALVLQCHGHAGVWLVIAIRAKANYEAALLRERRRAELKAEWEVVR